jgi:hypothetical protein
MEDCMGETELRTVLDVGPLAGLKTQQSRYREAMAALADRHRTLLVLVARPELRISLDTPSRES